MVFVRFIIKHDSQRSSSMNSQKTVSCHLFSYNLTLSLVLHVKKGFDDTPECFMAFFDDEHSSTFHRVLSQKKATE